MKSLPSRTTTRFFQSLVILLVLVGLVSCGQKSDSGTPPRSESQSVVPPNRDTDRYDLARDENRGGHTLSRHVARTDEQLQERLRKERNISDASSWTNKDIAEETVAQAVGTERARIERWMNRGERRPNLALHIDVRRPIGRSLRRGNNEAVSCTSAVVVLRAEGPNDFYVLTSYPEARE